MREALAGARAEQDDLGVQSPQKSEIFHAQLVERLYWPLLDAIGQHYHAGRTPLAVDHHVAFAVPGDRIDAARPGGVEFHARILQCVSFQAVRYEKLSPYHAA